MVHTTRAMESPEFIHIDVDEGPAHPDGLSMRFKRAGVSRTVTEIPYESERGLLGVWEVVAADDAEGTVTRPARAVEVDDSSEGVSWLVVGGAHGLLLTHRETRETAREPYLLLAVRAIPRSPSEDRSGR